MSLFHKVIVSTVLLAAQNTYAADYSLDASTIAVGATAIMQKMEVTYHGF